MNSIFAEEFYPKNTFKNYGKLIYFSNFFIFLEKELFEYDDVEHFPESEEEVEENDYDY